MTEPTAETLATALAAGPVLLDGGLATELEARGADLSDALWSARLLHSDPDAIIAAHDAYFRAGARVATSASYQATYEGFAAAGIGHGQAARLMRRSVALAVTARDGWTAADGRARWVAASVGPYGAMLADGSEYRGDYGLPVAALRAFHRPRLELLAAAGPDVLALETVPCLAEVEALLTEVADLGVPAWLSLSCSGTRTRLGEPVQEAFAMAADVAAVLAVGVNCCRPADVAGLVPLAAAGGLPVVAYPNGGQEWDAAARRWTGVPGLDLSAVPGWVQAGARLVGGCCRTGPSDIAALGRFLRPG